MNECADIDEVDGYMCATYMANLINVFYSSWTDQIRNISDNTFWKMFAFVFFVEVDSNAETVVEAFLTQQKICL